MSDDGRKLSELYGILEDMEDSLPDEEMRSKELIDNLKELNLKTSSVSFDEKKEQLAETPERIASTLTSLKKALELISPQANSGDARQFEPMKLYVDEILSLFNALNTENDLNIRAKLTAGIKEAYQNISAFLIEIGGEVILMDFNQIKKVVTEFIRENFRNSGKLVKLQRDGDKWVSRIEVLEESEYVRKFGITDIVGVYELEVSLLGDVLGFKRLLLRERTDLNSDE